MGLMRTVESAMPRSNHWQPLLAVSTLALTTVVAQAQDASNADATGAQRKQASVEEIVVSGSRLPSDLSSVPGSVSLIDMAAIAEQQALTNDIGQILSVQVPGLGVNSYGVGSNFDLTLRGRKPAVLIDGVPTTVPLRDGGRDLRTLAPSAIGNVEVIRGASAIYGLGGAGGIINYVTRNPGEGPVEFSTNFSAGASITHPSDSFNGNFEQSIAGRSGRLSYVFSGSYERYSSFFDADGDRLPPDPSGQGGLAENSIHNVFGKLRYDITDTQSLQLSINDYRAEQDTDYRAGTGVFGSEKTPSLSGADPRERNQFTDNFLATLRYAHTDVFGSSLSVQGYYAENGVRFRFNPAFADPALGYSGGQSQVFSDKRGLRMDINTPLSVLAGGQLLWGADLANDRTESVLADGRALTPLMDQTSWAPFAQLELHLTDRLTVRGGVRYEDISLDVPTFTTPVIVPSQPVGMTVGGGTLDYSETVENLGVVFDVTDQWNVFLAYSQGFSVADIGRVLIFTQVPSITTFNVEAQVIDNYEAGVRFDSGPVRGTLAYYVSKSDLGSTFNSVTFELLRAKEEVKGVELTLDADLTDSLRIGATYSHADGDRDSDGDGRLDQPLDTTRISPDKYTAYLQYEPRPQWVFRVQGLYSDSQNRFPGDVVPIFGRAPVNSFTLVDVTASMPLGAGSLNIGIQNLFNEEYFLPASERMATHTNYVMGTGATLTVGYRINY